jgi:hypothetical protein
MTMPKTSMYKNDFMLSTEHNVGSTRKTRDMQPIPEAHCMDHFPDDPFGLGVSAPNSAHLLTSLSAGQTVHIG